MKNAKRERKRKGRTYVLVLELSPVDALASHPVVLLKVASLDHEAWFSFSPDRASRERPSAKLENASIRYEAVDEPGMIRWKPLSCSVEIPAGQNVRLARSRIHVEGWDASTYTSVGRPKPYLVAIPILAWSRGAQPTFARLSNCS